MIIEGIDEVHNLHIAASLAQTKILVAMFDTTPKEVYESVAEQLKISVTDVASVVNQVVMTLKPWTNQVMLSRPIVSNDPMSELVN